MEFLDGHEHLDFDSYDDGSDDCYTHEDICETCGDLRARCTGDTKEAK